MNVFFRCAFVALLVFIGVTIGATKLSSDFINNVSASANLILATLTGVYAFLTYMLLAESRKANQSNVQLSQEQTRISMMPLLYCDAIPHENKAQLNVYNIGRVPAYDVDLYIIAVYSEEDKDIPTFIFENASTRGRTFNITANEEGFYGVFERAVYPIFPFGKKAELVLEAPEGYEMLFVLIQFRDVYNNNYSQLYLFTKENDTDTGRYALGSLEPQVLCVTPRLVMQIDQEKSDLVLESGGDRPFKFWLEFIELYRHAIPIRYLNITTMYVCEKGLWKDL